LISVLHVGYRSKTANINIVSTDSKYRCYHLHLWQAARWHSKYDSSLLCVKYADKI